MHFTLSYYINIFITGFNTSELLLRPLWSNIQNKLLRYPACKLVHAPIIMVQNTYTREINVTVTAVESSCVLAS